MEWKLIKRKDINLEKWNDCVLQSFQSNVYGQSWYLDAVTVRNWSGFILGDYIAVLPVEIKSKFCIAYITQPFLCQQLGIYSRLKDIDIHKVQELINLIKVSVWKFDMLTRQLFSKDATYTTKTNHILSIDRSYNLIYSGFNRNTKRNIKEASLAGLELKKAVSIEDAIPFFAQNDPTGLISKNYNKVQSLINSGVQVSKGHLWALTDFDKIRALAFFIIDGVKIYFILCSSDEKGKQTKAMYCLIDEIIKRYAQSQFFFDFTGSSIESIARRNLGFGAIEETYYHIKISRI